jgi:hypothetical protein
VVMGMAGSSAITISPMVVESRTRFHDSGGAVADAGDEDASLVITGVAGMITVAVSVLTGDADGWVHPAARRNAAMSTNVRSTVRTGDDMDKPVGMIRK